MKLPNLFEAKRDRGEVTYMNVVRNDVIEQLKEWTIALEEYENTKDIAKFNKAMDACRRGGLVFHMMYRRMGMLKKEHRAEQMAKKLVTLSKLKADEEKVRAAIYEKEVLDETLRLKHLQRLEKIKAFQHRIETRIRNREQWAKDHPTRKMVYEARQAASTSSGQ